MKFNLKQKCLLDASGELTDAARKALLEEVTQNPQANADYETAHENFAVFGALPLPEPSAAERKFIPAAIKQAVHGALRKREKQASRGRLLLRCAMGGGMALAACMVLFAGLTISRHNQNVRQQTQVARIQSMIDRVTLVDSPALAVVHPVQITTPSENEENGLGALAAVPEDRAELNRDASAPPGSF